MKKRQKVLEREAEIKSNMSQERSGKAIELVAMSKTIVDLRSKNKRLEDDLKISQEESRKLAITEAQQIKDLIKRNKLIDTENKNPRDMMRRSTMSLTTKQFHPERNDHG